ncbi:hypothetical protein [Lacticaseibacillus paracasei]|uniref:hypothetical protein n=1 Tax=Lacticaseibacillus paracasei TaxID=1597 RepID=UPI002A5AE2EC|nr:hypothetical protein [Lacticaseibacillus paracasei]MDY0837380.1 hypothetical protein [Lacticaseibacillus paracasei]
MATLVFKSSRTGEEREFDNVLSVTAYNHGKKESFSTPDSFIHAKDRLSGYNFDIFCKYGESHLLSENWLPLRFYGD